MTERVERRLAAIVAADVVGYSRLIGADEPGTIRAVRRLQSETIEPLLAAHRGRIVKTMGDGFLLEFASVVDGVEAAIALQRDLAKQTTGVPLQLRVGIHVGDIVIDGSDIFGEGVNIAARIEPLAPPGGIGISDDAYRQIRGRTAQDWTDGGEHLVKNIAHPVRVWHWSPDGTAPPAPENALPLPDKPSVAVLPFDNMSGDPEQEFFADGMTEDLITDLSKVSGLFVVARNSTFVFKGQPVDIPAIAAKLGVRYVVEGSVRKSGRRARINVQMIDAATGGHLWAERYDGMLDAVFELQDSVCAEVVSALSVHLTRDEADRITQVHTRNLDAYELFVRAKSAPYPPIPERIAAARAMFERVAEMDPAFAGGHAGIGWMIGFHAVWGHGRRVEQGQEAEQHARRAIATDDGFAWAHSGLGIALMTQRRCDEALAASRHAIELLPNDSDINIFHGVIEAVCGDRDRAIVTAERALRLNPEFIAGPYLNALCFINCLRGDHASAIEAHERNVIRGGPVGPPALAWAAASYKAISDEAGAVTKVDILKSRFPEFRLTGWNFVELLPSQSERAQFRNLMLAAGVPG